MPIRPETPADRAAIFAVHAAAFPTPAEAHLVDRLRDGGALAISLVAEVDGVIAGHIAFSPITLSSGEELRGAGLAPLAVVPAAQRLGLGSDLIRAGLAACVTAGFAFAVVLGHPDYYTRFGFSRASAVGLGNEYGVDAPFMVQALAGGRLPQPAVVRYSPLFAGV